MCRFDENVDVCGHKVCEDDYGDEYGLTEEEIQDEINDFNEGDKWNDALPKKETVDNVIYVDFVNRRRVA